MRITVINPSVAVTSSIIEIASYMKPPPFLRSEARPLIGLKPLSVRVSYWAELAYLLQGPYRCLAGTCLQVPVFPTAKSSSRRFPGAKKGSSVVSVGEIPA